MSTRQIIIMNRDENDGIIKNRNAINNVVDDHEKCKLFSRSEQAIDLINSIQ